MEAPCSVKKNTAKFYCVNIFIQKAENLNYNFCLELLSLRMEFILRTIFFQSLPFL